MTPSESPIIHVIRSITLLTILAAVPGIAIFWNHLPKKEVAPNPVQRSAPSKSDEARIDDHDSVQSAISLSAPKIASQSPIQQVSYERVQPAPQQDFALLRQRVNALGATYYKLEEWGSRGELFRFSCRVASSGQFSFEKPFEAVGSDPIVVIQSVIADIERWKGMDQIKDTLPISSYQSIKANAKFCQN